MLYFLTGVNSSLTKGGVSQPDPTKSLGGYISTTPVPNGEFNALFDLISSFTLEKRKRETMGIAIINKLDKPINNLTIKIVVKESNIASFKIAAVPIGDDMAMEKIPNRYASPMVGEFHSANFQRAYIDLKVLRPAESGEQIAIYPINKIVDVEESGMEGTFDAFVSEFYNDDEYEVIRISDNVFRIACRDERIVNNEEFSYLSDGVFSGEFIGVMKNNEVGEVTIIGEEDKLYPGKAVGIWLQREVANYKKKSNEKLIEDYKKKVVVEQNEEVELVTNYNIVEENNYNPEEYNPRNYS